MISGKTLPASPEDQKINPLILHLKEPVILLGWVAAILLIAALCWNFTQPLRNRFLINSINKVFELKGEGRRLRIQPLTRNSGLFVIGTLYNVTLTRQTSASSLSNYSDGQKALVFLFIGDGTFFPCVAMISPGGKVEEFIPLNKHGERIINQLSPGIIKLYTRRIEGAGI
jgi:hypothetical protein